VSVVGSPVPVVEGLAVVGVGAGVEQQPGQLERVAVGWGVVAALAVTEGAGEGGEGVFGFGQIAVVAMDVGVRGYRSTSTVLPRLEIVALVLGGACTS
jgi:hypothetical protein